MNTLDILMPMILFAGVIGIIGITAWLTWIIFKLRHKDKLAAPAHATPPPTIATPATEEVPFLKLTRSPFGEWEIFVEGLHYHTIEAIADEVTRKDIVAGLKALATFARNYVQKSSVAKKSQPSRAPESTPATESIAPVVLPFEPKAAPHTPQKTTRAPQAPPPTVQKVTPTPHIPSPAAEGARVSLSGETPLKRQDAAPVLMPSIDLAGEIDKIVSEMQKRIPSLAGRSIRIQNAPDGGIQFSLDGRVYPAIDTIPNRDVQNLIRAATQEWERR